MKLFRIFLFGIIAFTAVGFSSAAKNREKDISQAYAASVEEESETGATGYSTASAEEWGSALNSAASVADFGAIGDGVFDDSEAIQKAIDSDRPVYFPRGVYAISRPIIITDKSNWSMYAKDATFLYTGREYAFLIRDAQNCRIEIGQIKSVEGGGIEFYSDIAKSWNQYVSLTINTIECKTESIHVEEMKTEYEAAK